MEGTKVKGNLDIVDSEETIFNDFFNLKKVLASFKGFLGQREHFALS